MESSQVVYELNAEMVCGGCTGAIERILGKVDGITSVVCNTDTQKVHVTGIDGLDIAAMLQKWVSEK